MKAIIIAAGMGTRLLHLTKDMPKCKLKVHGKPLIEHTLDIFKELGITDISVVKGFLKEQISYPDVKSYYNDQYQDNNILTSLMYAREELNDEVIVVYSDIIFQKSVVEKLMEAQGNFCAVVDSEWRKNYLGRTLHPVSQAEKVLVEGQAIRRIGKHLPEEETSGEFIGMAKFSPEGCRILKQVYDELLARTPEQRFQHAPSLKKAYLTDMFQELVERGHHAVPVFIRGGWQEIDTLEDLKRAGGEITSARITPENRRRLLRQSLYAGVSTERTTERKILRAIEAHNGISAIVASTSILPDKKIGFDALWISSLTESAAKGQPDIEVMGFDSRLRTVSEILEVTNLPIIIDGDTGGDPNAFEYLVRRAEALGVSAVVIEDKVYPKRNSLDLESAQIQEKPELFAQKIRRGKHAQLTSDFMIIARIESFIAGKGVDDALFRAKVYLEAGVDGILIHSKSAYPDEVLSFARHYRTLTEQLEMQRPLICVPTTYHDVTDEELYREGFSIIIYANHLLRSAVNAMKKTCELILQHGKGSAVSPLCCSVSEVFDLVGFSDIKTKERVFQSPEVGKWAPKI